MQYQYNYLSLFTDSNPTTTVPTTTIAPTKLQLKCPHHNMELSTSVQPAWEEVRSWQKCADKCRSGHVNNV